MDEAYSTQGDGEKCMSIVRKVKGKRPFSRPIEESIKIYLED
jgi:hypothetical protein